jgi:hypothetical protein
MIFSKLFLFLAIDGAKIPNGTILQDSILEPNFQAVTNIQEWKEAMPSQIFSRPLISLLVLVHNTLYISPVTNKTTLVFNQRLANIGAFGVAQAVYENDILIEKGKRSKIEFGTLFTGEWNQEIMDNILMNNKLILYSDYLNKYGNIDFDWEMRLDLKVNRYVKANIGTHILYDDDVKDKENAGPKIQLKQLLGVGLTYSF